MADQFAQSEPSAYFSATAGGALAATALLLALSGGTGIVTGAALAACAGAIAALGLRVVAGGTGALLLLAVVLHEMRGIQLAAWVAITVLVGATMLRRLPGPSLPFWAWGLVMPLTVAAGLSTRWFAHGSAIWSVLLLASALGGVLGGFGLSRRVVGNRRLAVTARYALGDTQWLGQNARFLLLGRIAGGMAHELSQALNVITMANGNLGYVLDRANVPEPQGSQLTERVRKIATHADAAAQMLGHFRWFGQDGSRDSVEMTVSSALERAVGATRAAARKSGVVVEIRGDALTHPVPLRHGTIEMMATAALLEVMQALAQRPPDSQPPLPIVLEATRTEKDIEIAVLSRTVYDEPPVRDDIAEATYDLVTRLAASCRSELRRIGQNGHPVRFLLRLDRDVV
jgi:signal transduction histidine kinase